MLEEVFNESLRDEEKTEIPCTDMMDVSNESLDAQFEGVGEEELEKLGEDEKQAIMLRYMTKTLKEYADAES